MQPLTTNKKICQLQNLELTSSESDPPNSTQAENIWTRTVSKKRKAKVDLTSMLESYVELQKKQYDDFMQAEQVRQHQEKESLDNWMKQQMDVEERRYLAQREERQKYNRMFMTVFDTFSPSSHQQAPPQLQANPLHHVYSARDNITYTNLHRHTPQHILVQKCPTTQTQERDSTSPSYHEL
ncbi:unnamed protein product [Leuciscus chuanchicus]